MGIPTEIYYDPAKISKQMRHDDHLGIPWVLLLGPDELEKGVIKLKNLNTGEQKEVKLENLAKFINSCPNG